jgi:hypothetical protein
MTGQEDHHMRRTLAVLVIVAMVGFIAVPAADAGGRHGHHGAGVIGLAAFALFAPLIIAGEVLAAVTTIPYRATAAVVAAPGPYYAPAPSYYTPTATYYAPAPAYSTRSAYVEQVAVAPATSYASYAAPAYAAPAHTRVVRYSNGSYVLRGDGVYTAYRWVWIPSPPPPPPPPR